MDLKQKVQEFVEIAKACPENLREICFRPTYSLYFGAMRVRAR
jgi:hypothetical protein